MKSKDLTLPEIRLSWLDRAIGFFSPRALLRRKKAKIFNAYLERKYEGADGGRRTSGWKTASSSANREIAGGLVRLRDRSRDLVRNNPYAARGIQVISNNVVGRGIVTQIKVDDNRKTDRREKNLNGIWRAWAKTNAIDYEGVHNIFGLQRLVKRAIVESGEVLIRIRRTRRRRNVIGPDGQEYEVPPIQLQVLESDMIAATHLQQKLSNGNTIIQGIEIDPTGKKVAYHLYQSHPGGLDLLIDGKFKTVRVPASEILHPFRVDRPGQIRGVPWLAPVMLKLRDFDLYEDAQLKRQQVSAMFAAFIHDIEGIDDATEEAEEAEISDKMEPGLMEVLPPGKDIKFADPPGADNYKEYTSVVLHSIAAGLGITFESLTGDLSDVNFSSARMGWLEMQRNIETWRSNIMVNQFLDPVFGWFLFGLGLIGVNTNGARGVFTPPKREMIDPTKEVPALKMAVRSGFKTHSEAIREAGSDPDSHFEEIQSDNQTIDDLGLTLDSDPRKVNNSGTTQNSGG